MLNYLDDSKNPFIIVAGNSTSSDYTADIETQSNKNSSFIYAVDNEGNWRWGNYYQNGSNIRINSITGCTKNEKSGNPAFLAMADLAWSEPLIKLSDRPGRT